MRAVRDMVVFVAVFVASWLGAALLWALATDSPIKIVPDDVPATLIGFGAGMVGMLIAYLQKRSSVRHDG